jgi:serine protease Do
MRSSRRTMALLVLIMAGVACLGPSFMERVAHAITAGENQAERENLVQMSKQDQMSGLFRAVAKAVKPAVVVVQVKQKMASAPAQWPHMDDFFRRFFGDGAPDGEFNPAHPGRPFTPAPPGSPNEEANPRYYYQHGLGSGVIVDAQNGYVLTNWHVVHDADKVQVVFADKREFDAQWVRTDRQTDLAIIKIDPKNLVDAPLGDSDAMDVGDWVLAIGAPEGLPQTVTAGIISAKSRTSGGTGYEDFLQTDAAINHGNSGGPLVNVRGEVIGVNAAIVSRTGVNEGVGLAIPSKMIKNIMAQLIDGGKVMRGYLGIQIQNVDEKLAHSFGLSESRGALIANVMEDSPAQKAGLKAGDFIVAVDGRSIRDVSELRQIVADTKPNTVIKIDFMRDGKKQSASATTVLQSSDMEETPGMNGNRNTDAASAFGLRVAPVNDDNARRFNLKEHKKGVLILDVDESSNAYEQGLRPGDVITEVQGSKITSIEDLESALSSEKVKSGCRVKVEGRAGGMRYAFITPKNK